MYCSNCGAELKESDVTCPYCGMLQPSAAESEYMQKLEHLKQDVTKSQSCSHKGIHQRTAATRGFLLLRLFLLFSVSFFCSS